MKWHALLLALLVPGVCAGQTLPAEATAPHMVRAAGMPLNDGTLPPGMLTVRLVQGAFTDNLVNQVVEVEVIGGKVDTAPTGADGRAPFAHLPVGARVRASATIDGERLASEVFEMPAESGVRLLLVAGGDATVAAAGPFSAPTPWTAAPATTPVATAQAPQIPTAPPADPTVAAIRAVLATTTVFAFGALVLYRRPRQARR